MFDSLATYREASVARAASLPGQLVAPSPAREVLLEGWRRRNAALDYLFYDLGQLDPGDAARLAPTYAAEGAILAVAPGKGGKVDLIPNIDALARSPLAMQARILTVAGVGSSALGAAAFARNVADAAGAPALAVVSGYGLADLVNEAMGGFFLFGALNSLRHGLEPLDTALRASSAEAHLEALSPLRASLDVKTLLALLAVRDFDLLVGHSKGNLVISEALFALGETLPERNAALAQAARIVTVSAKIYMPPPWRGITDVMGALDAFGLMNSRLTIPTDVLVPFAWHHTNTELPMHLPVTKVLSALL